MSINDHTPWGNCTPTLSIDHVMTYGQLHKLVSISVAAQGKQFKVAKKDRTRVRLRCPAGKESCRFSVYATPHRTATAQKGPRDALLNIDMWKIVTLNLTHTCDGTAKRKTNYHCKFVRDGDPVMKAFKPSSMKGANSQLRMLVAHSDQSPYKLTRGQAHAYLKRITNDSVDDAILQYHFLGSFLKRMKELDQHGTYIYKTEHYHEDNQYERLTSYYVCPSSSKKFMECSRNVIAVDGTYLTGHIGGILLTATGKVLI